VNVAEGVRRSGGTVGWAPSASVVAPLVALLVWPGAASTAVS